MPERLVGIHLPESERRSVPTLLPATVVGRRLDEGCYIRGGCRVLRGQSIVQRHGRGEVERQRRGHIESVELKWHAHETTAFINRALDLPA